MMKYLLAGYMFLFIYRPFETHPFLAEIHLERIWIIIALLYFIFFHHKVPRKKVLIAPVTAFSLVILCSWLVAFDPEGWSKVTETYLKEYIFFLLLIFSVNTEEELLFLVKAFVIIVAIYEVKSLNDYFFHGRCHYRQGIRRLIGIDVTYCDPNAMAATINYTIPYGIAWFKHLAAKKIERKFVIFFMAVSIICIVLTGSRAGFITLCINGILLWSLSRKNLGTFITFILAGCIIWICIPESNKERIQSILNPTAIEDTGTAKQAEDSLNSRTLGLKDGFNMLLDRPVLGFGAGGFKAGRPSLGTDGLRYESHNLYGQIMGELGLVGVFAFCVLLTSLVRTNKQIINLDGPLTQIGYANIISMMMLLFNGYGSHNLYRYNWLWLAGFTSVLAFVALKPKEIEQDI